MAEDSPKKTRFEKIELETGAFPCPACGEANEPERETCWACFRVLKAAAPAPKTPPPAAAPAPPEPSSAARTIAFAAGVAAAGEYPLVVMAEWNSIAKRVWYRYAAERRIGEMSVEARERMNQYISRQFDVNYPHFYPMCIALAAAAWVFSRAWSFQNASRPARAKDALAMSLLALLGAVFIYAGESAGNFGGGLYIIAGAGTMFWMFMGDGGRLSVGPFSIKVTSSSR